MTPGFAKSRKELFWLPYPEPDRVIINAHNFTPAVWTPSVNGKDPIAAWCPSRDTAGNGTTTLTDLYASNDGTLTNMDATDWISDTGAGGSLALDLDGVNDCVRCGSGMNSVLNGVCSYSMWGKFRSRTGVNALLSNIASSGDRGQQLEIGRTTNKLSWLQNGATVDATSTGTITDANWHHVVVVRTGTTNAWTITFYIDGASSSHSTSANPWGNTAQNGQFTIGRVGDFSAFFQANVIFDDVRVFALALDSTDVAALYASGLGRGIQA